MFNFSNGLISPLKPNRMPVFVIVNQIKNRKLITNSTPKTQRIKTIKKALIQSASVICLVAQ